MTSASNNALPSVNNQSLLQPRPFDKFKCFDFLDIHTPTAPGTQYSYHPELHTPYRNMYYDGQISDDALLFVKTAYEWCGVSEKFSSKGLEHHFSRLRGWIEWNRGEWRSNCRTLRDQRCHDILMQANHAARDENSSIQEVLRTLSRNPTFHNFSQNSLQKYKSESILQAQRAPEVKKVPLPDARKKDQHYLEPTASPNDLPMGPYDEGGPYDWESEEEEDGTCDRDPAGASEKAEEEVAGEPK